MWKKVTVGFLLLASSDLRVPETCVVKVQLPALMVAICSRNSDP